MQRTTHQHGFTLIETLVAVTILVSAVVGPMTLAAMSLSSAFYARDQVTAFHLAQEAVETVRNVRDSNILRTVQGTPTDLFGSIPSTAGQPFIVDTRNDSMSLCGGDCPPLENNGELYGYGDGPTWETTRFTREVRVDAVGESLEEYTVAVTVRWQTGAFQERSFTISENMYRWIDDGSGEEE